MSPARSNAGPAAACRRPPISRAMMMARVVLPSPGGPKRRAWSKGSPRCLAAAMKTASWRRTLGCPMYSARVAGRRRDSNPVSESAGGPSEEGLGEGVEGDDIGGNFSAFLLLVQHFPQVAEGGGGLDAAFPLVPVGG